VFASQIALLVLVTYRVIPAVIRLSGLGSQLVSVVPWTKGIIDIRASLVDATQRPRVPVGRAAVPEWQRLRLEHVQFRYPGSERAVIDGVSVTFDRGSVYGLIGPSGAGKSTLVDLMLGLLEPTSGAVLVGATPLAELDVAAWQRRIGYVPQAPYFTDDTIRANVAFGVPRQTVDEARVHRCLAMASLADLVAALPQGLDTSLGDRAVKISGGERQRIAIARALYRDPELLVLDEATSALDPASQHAVARALEALRGRVTTIIISHQTSAIETCDRVFVLDGGRLVAEGSSEDVVLGSSLREAVPHGS
jgi:ABC-type multidrug transport system fused ATPase/permease subunit